MHIYNCEYITQTEEWHRFVFSSSLRTTSARTQEYVTHICIRLSFTLRVTFHRDPLLRNKRMEFRENGGLYVRVTIEVAAISYSSLPVLLEAKQLSVFIDATE